MISGVFALLALAALIAALILAIFGWAVSMPDGVQRFTYRLWAWISALAFYLCSFAVLHHPRWWNWALAISGVFWSLNRLGHWWRQLELVRRFEREVARGTLRKLS